MCVELGACLGNGCLHVCGIGCILGERLGACMRNWVHVCGVGRMSGERSLACLRSWVLVWQQGAFPKSQAGPGPGPIRGHVTGVQTGYAHVRGQQQLE